MDIGHKTRRIALALAAIIALAIGLVLLLLRIAPPAPASVARATAIVMPGPTRLPTTPASNASGPTTVSPLASVSVPPATTAATKISENGCTFENPPNYLRPEHLLALQPRFRAADQLPPAPPLYELSLSVQPAAYTFSGTATISFFNRSPQAMPNIMLRTYPDFFKSVGGEVSLKAASLNGQSLNFSERAPTYAEARLDTPLPACAQARLSVTFEGKIAARLREDAYAIGTFYAGPGFFALANFYPQLALWEKRPGQAAWDWTVTPVRASADLTAADAAFYDVRLAVPPSYQLTGAGLTTPPEQSAAGLKNWRFVGGPFREFAVVGGENFTSTPPETVADAGNIRLKVLYATQPDPAIAARQQDFARKALEATRQTLSEFGKAIGPYPFVEFTLVEFPLVGFNGVEWPMFSQFSFNLFRANYQGQEQSFGGLAYSKPGTLVVIHEVLHQWWYNLVGNDQQSEPFIDEGLTEYCVYLLPELWARSNNGSLEAAQSFAQGWLNQLRLRIKQQDRPAFGDLRVNQPAAAFNLEQAGLILYRKAPLFYDAFRAKFGDPAFFAFLKSYYQGYRYRLVHYADLVESLVAAVPGREAEARALVERWFNTTNLAIDLP